MALTCAAGNNATLLGAIGMGAGIFVFYGGFRALQRRRLILNTPCSKIRSASIGLVEVNGLAIGPRTITAPCSGLACYYYQTKAWQMRKSGDRNEQWQEVAQESMHVPFFLDDNTGRVLIEPEGAEMDLHCDMKESYNCVLSGNFDVPGGVLGFLTRNGVPSDVKTKIEEYCIKPKNALFVLGTLATNPGITIRDRSSATGGGDAATAESTGATTYGADPARVAMALARAGISNPVAWAAAGVDRNLLARGAAGAAAAPAVETQEFEDRPPVVLMKGTHNPAFMISWRSQHDVVRKLGWQSTLMIWGGPALALASLYFLLLRLGMV